MLSVLALGLGIALASDTGQATAQEAAKEQPKPATKDAAAEGIHLIAAAKRFYLPYHGPRERYDATGFFRVLKGGKEPEQGSFEFQGKPVSVVWKTNNRRVVEIQQDRAGHRIAFVDVGKGDADGFRRPLVRPGGDRGRRRALHRHAGEIVSEEVRPAQEEIGKPAVGTPVEREAGRHGILGIRQVARLRDRHGQRQGAGHSDRPSTGEGKRGSEGAAGQARCGAGGGPHRPPAAIDVSVHTDRDRKPPPAGPQRLRFSDCRCRSSSRRPTRPFIAHRGVNRNGTGPQFFPQQKPRMPRRHKLLGGTLDKPNYAV